MNGSRIEAAGAPHNPFTQRLADELSKPEAVGSQGDRPGGRFTRSKDNGDDVWLHILLAAPAAYFGFVHRDDRISRI